MMSKIWLTIVGVAISSLRNGSKDALHLSFLTSGSFFAWKAGKDTLCPFSIPCTFSICNLSKADLSHKFKIFLGVKAGSWLDWLDWQLAKLDHLLLYQLQVIKWKGCVIFREDTDNVFAPLLDMSAVIVISMTTSLWGCWIIVILEPWKEVTAVEEYWLWSILSIADVTNTESHIFGGWTPSSTYFLHKTFVNVADTSWSWSYVTLKPRLQSLSTIFFLHSDSSMNHETYIQWKWCFSIQRVTYTVKIFSSLLFSAVKTSKLGDRQRCIVFWYFWWDFRINIGTL